MKLEPEFRMGLLMSIILAVLLLSPFAFTMINHSTAGKTAGNTAGSSSSTGYGSSLVPFFIVRHYSTTQDSSRPSSFSTRSSSSRSFSSRSSFSAPSEEG